jgi:ABC-type uncharacterized transport system permease subunit
VERLAYVAPLALYAALAFVHLLPGVWAWGERNTRSLGGIGVTAHAFALGVALTGGHPGLAEALSATSCGLMVAWLLTASGSMKNVGLALTPLGTVILGTSMVVPDRQVAALSASGPSPWLPVHLGLTFAGLAGFALSFGVGVLYLVARYRLKHKDLGRLRSLPPLEWLDRLQFRATLFGFVFLTLGIAAGGAWAAATLDELERPWAFDPKIFATLVLWAWYGVALQVRLLLKMRGRWSALMGIVGFTAAVSSMIAFRFVAGWHGGG